MIDALAGKFRALEGADVQTSDPEKTRTHLDVVVPGKSLRAAAQILRDAEFMIESAGGFDATPSMLVNYHFVRVDRPLRVVLRALVDRDGKTSPTIQDIFPGANWHERETRDFYGIMFEGHPDMTPLILPEDAVDLHPLLKADEKALKDLSAALPRFPAPPKAEAKAEAKEGEA